MEDDGCGEMLERIRADLGLAVSLNAQATIAQAASDLGIDAPGGTLRAQVAVVCQELGVETGWDTTTHGDTGGSSSATDTDVGGLQPEPEPEDGGGEEEDWAAISELPDDEKLRIIFGLFDEDGDGYLNRAEAGTYSRAKQGLDIDDEAWAGVCEALGVEQGIGLALQDFKRMYEMTQGEGNDLRVDYMRLCEGLTITTSIVRTGSVRAAAQDVVLVVRVTGTEASPNGKDELFIVEVTEEDDDYAISLMKYRYKEFQLLRKQLVAHFPEVKNLDFPKAGKSCRLEKLHLWLTNLMDHPDVRCASEFCQFLNIATPTDSDAQEIDFDADDAGEESRMAKTLTHMYSKLVQGVPGMQTALDMAEEFRLKVHGTMRQRADALIRAQNMKAAGQGFITSLGGLPFLPATIPANILALFYVWIRMSAAIAHMGGHDVASDETKALVFLTILGGDVPDLPEDESNAKLIEIIIKRILFAFGKKTAGNVARKAVPIIAGFANAAFDANWTDNIGNTARDIFIPPDWVKDEQTRTGLGIRIFFPDSRTWVQSVRERIEADAEGTEVVTALTQRASYYDQTALPKIISARTDHKRSTYITVTNDTPWVLTLDPASAPHLESGEWTVEPPTDILPGEQTVPCGAHAKSKIEGTIELLAETGSGQIKLFLAFHNGSGHNWWDASTSAPLRVDAFVTAEKNNMVAFKVLAGAGTCRKHADVEITTDAFNFDPAVLVGVDIAREIQARAAHADRFVVPTIVKAVRHARRSSYVRVSNETEFQLHCVKFHADSGSFTRDPTGEIFGGETIIFGTESGKAGGTEGWVRYAVLDVTTGLSLSFLWIAWGNPLVKGERAKWWDAECDAPLRVDAMVTNDDNNQVTFRILKGGGTVRKYGGSSGSQKGGASGLPRAVAAAPVMSEAEMADEILRRRDLWNANALPLLIQGQMSASRSSFILVTNHTSAMFTRATMSLDSGMWTVEPPAEIFPQETDVPFGSQSHGISSTVEGTMELVTDTADAGQAVIWFKWSNAGRGHIYADAEAPHGFVVSVTSSDAENNNIKFVIDRGEGTRRGTALTASPVSGGGAAVVVAAVERSDEVVHRGWLEKKGDGGVFGSKSFQRRWCECSARRLRVLTEEGGKQKAEVDMASCAKVCRVEGEELKLELVQRQKDGAWKVHEFQGHDEASVSEWVRVLSELVR